MNKEILDKMITNTFRGFLLLVALIAYFVMLFIIEGEKPKKIIEYIVKEQQYYSRDDINNVVLNDITGDSQNDIYTLFDKLTGDRVITFYIVNNSLTYDVPISISLAIAMTENPQFNPDATNKNNNGSIDVGIFQTNTNTFQDYTVDDLLKPNINIRCGIWLLAEEKKRYGTWTEAICQYHRGNKIDQKGLKYIDDVLNNETAVIKMFNTEYGEIK